jgi:hypothetical protein
MIVTTSAEFSTTARNRRWISSRSALASRLLSSTICQDMIDVAADARTKNAWIAAHFTGARHASS